MISNIVDSVAAKAQKSIRFNDGDYYGNGSITLLDYKGEKALDGDGKPITDKGLLYCGRCKQLKQTRLFNPVTKKIISPPVFCQCEIEKDEQARAKIIEDNKQIQIQRNLSQSDALMLKNTFAKDTKANSIVSQLCREYCRHWRDKYFPKNIGLYIFGGVGVGKSFYASCIANEIARVYGDTVKAVSATRIINDLFGTESKSAYIDSLASVDLLVIDDFGAERKTDYGMEQIFSVVDERYKAQKPLILTSNYDYSALRQKASVSQQRIYDRVKDMCLPVKIEGSSMRGIVI